MDKKEKLMKIINNEVGRDALYKIWNSTDENMIIYFSSSGGSIVYQDAIYPMESGSLCFIKEGKQHYTMPDNPADYVRSKIFLSDKNMRSLLSSLASESAFSKLFSENSVVYAKIPESERGGVEKEFKLAAERCALGRCEGVASAFFSLMCVLSEHAVHHIKSPDGFMGKAIEYVNENYPNDISLDELCRLVNMSKSHFCRRFKIAMGITVMEYILTTRIAAAKNLLISSELSVSQVSDLCGFSSISYFCQTFKEHVGITAREFREKRGIS